MREARRASIRRVSDKFRTHRQDAFAIGASSAFDMSGLRFLHHDLCPAPAWTDTDAAGAIGRDFAKVMLNVRRATRCAAKALDAGADIEHLAPGCTMRMSEQRETREAALRRS